MMQIYIASPQSSTTVLQCLKIQNMTVWSVFVNPITSYIIIKYGSGYVMVGINMKKLGIQILHASKECLTNLLIS